MTPSEHAHAQALNEAHDLFGGHEIDDDAWGRVRDEWVAARERRLVGLPPRTPHTNSPAPAAAPGGAAL